MDTPNNPLARSFKETPPPPPPPAAEAGPAASKTGKLADATPPQAEQKEEPSGSKEANLVGEGEHQEEGKTSLPEERPEDNDPKPAAEEAKVVGHGAQPRAAPMVSLACCVRGTSPSLAPRDPLPSGEAMTAPQRRVSSAPSEPQDTAARRLTFVEGAPPRRPSLRSESSGEASPAKRGSSHDGGSSTGTGRRKINLF